MSGNHVVLKAWVDQAGQIQIDLLRPVETGGFESGPPGVRAMGEQNAPIADAAFRRPVRDRLQQRIVDKLRDRVAEAGGDLAKFDQVVADLEATAKSDTPWLDWLKDGGFEALLKFIMELIALLG